MRYFAPFTCSHIIGAISSHPTCFVTAFNILSNPGHLHLFHTSIETRGVRKYSHLATDLAFRMAEAALP